MAIVAESPKWQTVGAVIDQNARDFLSGRFGLLQDIVAWFKAIELFREAENDTMILRDPTPEDLRQHRIWLASLLAEGERLAGDAQTRGGLAADAVRFRLTDVEAVLEELYVTQREWHGGMSPGRRREILKTFFNFEEPAT
jgi:hypothetical protein